MKWIGFSEFLRRHFPWLVSTNPVECVTDLVLGDLMFSEEWEAWVYHLSEENLTFEVQIGGFDFPDPQLIEHAREIAASPHRFLHQIVEHLESEIRTDKYYKDMAEEIRQLEVAFVMLPWPYRPNDGMVYFKDVFPDRFWRLDLEDRKPCHLSYDS